MPAGFHRHLMGKTLRNVFTVISLKYAFQLVNDEMSCVNMSVISYVLNADSGR